MTQLVNSGMACKSCTSSDAMAEYTDGFYCFSCQKQMKKEKSLHVGKKFNNIFREDWKFVWNTTTVPKKVQQWLNKCYITKTLMQKYKLFWCNECWKYSNKNEKLYNAGQRLIIPYFKEGKMISWDARSFDDDEKLKYVSGGPKDLFYIENLDKINDTMFIVEDSISAIRLGEYVTTVALRGLNVIGSLNNILSLDKNVVIWLDKDIPGQKAASQLQRKLELLKKTLVVRDYDEPKTYSPNELKRLVWKFVLNIKKIKND